MIDFEIFDQQVPISRRHVFINRHLNDRTELAPADALLHGLQQIVRFDFLDFHVCVADDAERMRGDHFHAREERLQIGNDHLLEPHEIMVIRNRAILADVA